jgi:LysR family transcriptional regulator (chromosome initiation inhibitor)
MSLLSPQLEAFIAIVKHKTVHAAAETIFLTQTAVTQRIRTLENQLGTTLFIRTRRGMLLTPEGEALLRYCQAAKELEGEALANIQGAGTKSDVTLCITAATSIMHARIIPSCLSVMKRFPHLFIQFIVSDLENRHQTLRSGECDFAIIQEEQLADEMQYKKLTPEEYVLVCSSKWKNRELKDIIKYESIIDFDPSDQMTFQYLKQCDLFSLAKHQRHFVNRTEGLALMISQGLGYGTLAKEFAQPYIQDKQLILLNKGETLNINPFLVWYERHASPDYFSALIKAIE